VDKDRMEKGECSGLEGMGMNVLRPWSQTNFTDADGRALRFTDGD
jgi:hypothetical protein